MLPDVGGPLELREVHTGEERTDYPREADDIGGSGEPEAEYHPDGEDDELENKIYSAHCSVEVIEGELTGVITAKVIGELSDEDMSKFIRYCSGQLSDGWGESLEQKYLKIGGSEINVSFWNSSDDWRLLPEKEYLDSLTQCEDMGMGGLS